MCGCLNVLSHVCRDSLEFRRLVLRYSSNGQVTSLTKEVYRPEDDTDFEFLRRNSTSVRRSVDSRQRRYVGAGYYFVGFTIHLRLFASDVE